MKFQILGLVVAALLGGCAEVHPITTADGRKGFVVSCDGEDADWGTCYSAAAEACDGKYNIIDRYDRRARNSSGREAQRTIVVQCGRTRHNG